MTVGSVSPTGAPEVAEEMASPVENTIAAIEGKWYQDKRVILVGLLVAFIAISFWAGSRIPALNEKAVMGGDTQLEALGFETLIEVQPDDGMIFRAIATTVNWMETNKKGMTFGVLLAASLMLLLSLFRGKSLRSGFANSLLGMTIGAPLGVCVNCAAPIAKGLHSAGARAETMLAAMMSSPTLNLIVLTMLFSLFPLYIVVIKLGLTLLVLLVVVPLLIRFLLTKEERQTADLSKVSSDACEIPLAEREAADTWPKAGWWTIRHFFKNLWYIVKTTVPLMILAGFIGAVIITVLPWDSMADILPSDGILASKLGIPRPVLILLSLGIVGLIGLALPVPIAFDIMVPAILLATGMPVRYVMVLLFTLGIFSIYPFFIVWNAMPKRVVLSLTAVLLFLGVAAGVAAHRYAGWEVQKQRAMFFEVFGSASSPEGLHVSRVERERPGQPASDLVPRLQRDGLVPVPVGTSGDAAVSVARVDFAAPSTGSDGFFARFEGERVGLDEPYSFSVLSSISITRFRGIAVGDIHHDGWVDVLLTSDVGLSLYANDHGKGFVLQDFDIPGLSDFYVVNAALVDLNNDGWLDIFFATYREGNYLIYNRDGRFPKENLHSVPNQEEAILTSAVAFGDLDRDGDLDVVLGNWSLGEFAHGSLPSSRNVLLENGPSGFQIRSLAGITGETLTTLLSDFNNDGYLDLIVGNDFRAPDHFYLGRGDGSFDLITREAGIIPHSTTSTMNLASADINNDLMPEIYIGQVSGFDGGTDLPIHRIGRSLCKEFEGKKNREQCEYIMSVHPKIVRSRNTRDAYQCRTIDAQFREDCIAVILLMSALREQNQQLCDLFPESWDVFAFVCNGTFAEQVTIAPEDLAPTIRQIRRDNVLLMSDGNGKFVDRATEMGVEVGGWTWNAKFGDVDNDEWLDLYIVNGRFANVARETNLFYHNQQGQQFADKTDEYGLTSFRAAASYAYIDMDHDGDLDIITVPTVGPVIVYVNNGATGNSIAFELRDQVGNHFGVGSKIVIHYGPDESRHQVREIQAGGGFVSFDAPIAHFGLGEHAGVGRVEILWSTGERSELRGDFAAGARYIISRRAPGGPRAVARATVGQERLRAGTRD